MNMQLNSNEIAMQLVEVPKWRTTHTPQSRSRQKLESLKLFHKWIEIYSLAIK